MLLPAGGEPGGGAAGAPGGQADGVHFGGGPGGPAQVLGDEAGLRQVVGNLLSNVRVHTPADSPLIIEVAAHGEDAAVLLRISDSGPGLSGQDAARAFDRFFRAAPDRARDTGGAGLGMSIVQARRPGPPRQVALDTAPGRGLTVLVTLPAARTGAKGRRRRRGGPGCPSCRGA